MAAGVAAGVASTSGVASATGSCRPGVPRMRTRSARSVGSAWFAVLYRPVTWTRSAGTGVQFGTVNRWGDYTSMNVDPTDDCTFWYVNEYYELSGVIGVNTVPFQTRIGSFRLPSCQ